VIVNKKTKLVVEGFPRSANTFAYNLFEKVFINMGLNPKRIAHHTHSAAQIIYGVKHKIPVVVLIREPISAVTSLIIMKNLKNKNFREISDLYLKQYISFYNKIKEQKDNVIVADFKEIINDYNRIIERVNNKYRRNFCLLEQETEEKELMIEKIKNDTIKKFKNDYKKLSIPSNQKDDYKRKISPIVEKSKYSKEATELYMLIKNNNNYIH